MTNKPFIYLDHSATTAVRPEVREAMLPFMDTEFGNASSLYSLGQRANEAMKKARQQVANALGASPNEIIFTSGGTESDNFALRGIIKASKDRKHIITSSIEHPAILKTCKDLEKYEGVKVTYLPVDKYAMIKLEDLENAITEETILVSIMYANNEVGTIQPLEQIGTIIKKAEEKYGKRIYFHTDAVQAVGKIPVNVEDLNLDLLSLSSHKIYGPKGVGALYVKKGTKISPIITGGVHEANLRAGTENVAGIVGLGKAIDLSVKEMDIVIPRMIALRDYLMENLLKIEHTQLNGHKEQRLPNNVNISFNFIEGEGMLFWLDDEGIYASTGSACSSKSLEPSHVLLEMGIPHEIAHGSLRLTLGFENTKEEMDRVLEVMPQIVAKLRAMSPLYKC